MHLRTATNADCTAVKRVIFSVLEEYGLKPDPQGTDRDLDRLEEAYIAGGGWFAVLEVDGHIVATVGLKRVSADTCELHKMYCLASYRGRGLGRLLLDSAVAKARELGYCEMILETASVLKEAVAMYARYGFREYTPAHRVSRCDRAMKMDLRVEDTARGKG